MSSNETAANPFDGEESIDTKHERFQSDTYDISYHDIATKLLNDNLLLTALELHAELVEAGKELPKLRVFFSNPGNFEQLTVSKPELLSSPIPRSLSQATLDSLDLTRYSEDGERGIDERIAVLEFELRKAKETITALRANLTVATESETLTPDGTAVKSFGSEPVKPHEQRALNFLINEYLLLHGYKLTSITFADENEKQDFEDWDDVGLNIPKPAELLQLYRDHMRQSGCLKQPSMDEGCQTDHFPEQIGDGIESCASAPAELRELTSDIQLLEKLKVDVVALQEQVTSLEMSKLELQEKLWSYERLTDNSEPLEEQNNRGLKTNKERFQRDDEDADGWTAVIPLDLRELQQTINEEDQISADIDWASVTMSTPDPVKVTTSDSQSGSGSGSACGASDTRGLIMEDEERMTDGEWTPVSLSASQGITQGKSKSLPSTINSESLHIGFERSLSAAFCQEVLSSCTVDTSHFPESHQHILQMLNKVSELRGPTGLTDKLLIDIFAKTVLKLLPCVILNKREEVIPLLVALVRLNVDGKERDSLLHQLFNLKKRPDIEERCLILAGLLCVARGMEAVQVENEVLPQCWEQMSHRHVERRLLVAEACGILAPFVTGAIRNSLMLSMLQQMLSEDREETVRAAVVRSTALIAAMSPDCDKYSQCEDLVISCISDPSSTVIQCLNQTLLPVVAHWALTSGRFQSSLLIRLMNQLSLQLQVKPIDSPRSPSAISTSPGQTFQAALNATAAFTAILPYLVLSVANVGSVIARISPDLPAPQSRIGFSDLCRGLSNPLIFHHGSITVGQIIAAFDATLKDLDPSSSWPELLWISDKMLPALIEVLCNVTISQEELLNAFVSFFRYMCSGFGPIFVSKQVKPVFVSKLQEIEQTLVEVAGSNQKSAWPSLSVLVVYLAGVVASGQSESDTEELRSTLRRFLMALPLCSSNAPNQFGSVPIDGLQAAISAICGSKKENVHEAVIATLWEGVVSQRALVRCSTATLFAAVIGLVPETLISARVAPALVTLASDPDVSVKAAAIPTFGKLIVSTSTKEVKEKICFQLQSLLSDPVTRDSHPLLLQIVCTLGQVVSSCDTSFRDDVIMPQLAALAAYASQLQNLTRRLDLAVALTEAFSAAVYIPFPASILTTAVLPGLRYLEQISQQLQPVHRETILAMIREVESRSDASPFRQEERRTSRSLASATANMNQGVEDMRQRMSKMFQPKNVTNQPGLPSLFRKK
ncbi:RAB11-binding protein RELCH [Frankliniella occidentalis]|uniref:RAB11-binding protein RELCH n=1 Tax=Frankliniella occidentalis TaxID=133901 RepID=A0A9C6UAU1_FRAOC|nr:RAB11-binding protein RELCH [Frankliniella occidentalis]